MNPGPLDQKYNALVTEPKSRLPDTVVRDWLYTQKLCIICLCRYSNVEWPFVTLPTLRKSSFRMTQSHFFFAKESHIPDEAPSYDMKVVTKKYGIVNNDSTPAGFERSTPWSRCSYQRVDSLTQL